MKTTSAYEREHARLTKIEVQRTVARTGTGTRKATQCAHLKFPFDGTSSSVGTDLVPELRAFVYLSLLCDGLGGTRRSKPWNVDEAISSCAA